MKDDPRPGRKVTVSTDKRIAAIEEYVMKDRRITVWQVGETFDKENEYFTNYSYPCCLHGVWR